MSLLILIPCSLIAQAPKIGRYGANPVAEQEKLHELEKRIQRREEALSSPELFANVRVLSRHALEVEQSLHRGTEKGSSLSHLVQPRKQGGLVCCNWMKHGTVGTL